MPAGWVVEAVVVGKKARVARTRARSSCHVTGMGRDEMGKKSLVMASVLVLPR